MQISVNHIFSALDFYLGLKYGLRISPRVMENRYFAQRNMKLYADAMYFFGAALTTYLGIPFIFPELKTTTEKWQEGFLVKTVFPEPIHTHCAEQTFYFNKEGLLVRHDYQAEIISKLAIGTHFTNGYKEIKSLPVATKRDVYVRLGSFILPIPVLFARLEPVDVVFK